MGRVPSLYGLQGMVDTMETAVELMAISIAYTLWQSVQLMLVAKLHHILKVVHQSKLLLSVVE